MRLSPVTRRRESRALHGAPTEVVTLKLVRVGAPAEVVTLKPVFADGAWLGVVRCVCGLN